MTRLLCISGTMITCKFGVKIISALLYMRHIQMVLVITTAL
jgi:hypothetical protein